MKKLKFLHVFSLISALIFSSTNLDAQSTLVNDEFLEGLPPSIKEEMEVQNQVNADDELETLFRTDTSMQKNNAILQKIKTQLKTLQRRMEADEGSQTNKDGLMRFGENFFSSIQSSFMPINIPNLSGDYVVDVGDEFKVLFTGSQKKEVELMVQRDGSLLIPSIGKVVVAGDTLENANKKIQNFIASRSAGVIAYTTLSKASDIQIMILGYVEAPGMYTLAAGSNILSSLNVAGGILANGTYRNIELKRAGKTLKVFDLYDTFAFGNFTLDQSIRSGDTIFVNSSSFQIPVSGGVNYEAIYEARVGESAQDLITFAGGFSESFSGFDKVNIRRQSLSKSENFALTTKDLINFKLQPRDSILIPTFASTPYAAKTVLLEGMVKRPGTYFIDEGETLSQVIQRAGGYKDGAYTYGAALFRQNALEKEKEFAQLNYSDTINYIVSNVGKPNANVTIAALDFLAEELRSKNYTGRVIASFDLEDITENKSLDSRLRDNDRVVIPPLEKVVYLFGDFKNPSNISYDSDFQPRDYLELVGGLKDSAYKEILIIDPDGKTHLYSQNIFNSFNKIDIYPGTIIYAPRNIGKLSGVVYAASVSPILSSLALSLASLNSISD